jgi:Gnt-I system high-affinity gluconate transporter
MVPLIITISKRYNIPVVYIGLPVVAALSVTHGYLPPHPAPTALVKQFNADLGLTMFYGILIAIPAGNYCRAFICYTFKKIYQQTT